MSFGFFGLYGGYRIVWRSSIVLLPISFTVLTLYFSSVLFWLVEGDIAWESMVSTICYMLINIGLMPAGLGFTLLLLISIVCPPLYNIFTQFESFLRFSAIVLAFLYMIVIARYLKRDEVRRYFSR